MNEDGEVVAKRKDGKDGPWNKLGDTTSNQAPLNSVYSEDNRALSVSALPSIWYQAVNFPHIQGSMEEREEIPEQKREAVELLASSNVVGGSYVPPHMRGQVRVCLVN